MNKEEAVNALNDKYKQTTIGRVVRPRKWLFDVKTYINLHEVNYNKKKIAKLEAKPTKKNVDKVVQLQARNETLENRTKSYSRDKINLSAVGIGVSILDVQLFAMQFSGIELAVNGAADQDLGTVATGAAFYGAARDYKIANTKPENLIGINHAVLNEANYDKDPEIQKWRKNKNPVSFAKMMFSKKQKTA